ncbi:T9SS type A sorting domain-containing protein [Marinoscillum furvescens]|uniref:Putative secreted protein (Por secretion system target) n=1 Tax=Marinoscillum furvescens DSM 4134 TaxID=1122208 RepID=A0A3D9KZT6_MARFU|nr:T9SS type A sorting domain-containing protein [Marinoscillum furvescens]RED96168.1 putative secreted protein (Por secretion system target) [Marinoscillum furvescens DSM 4134]
MKHLLFTIAIALGWQAAAQFTIFGIEAEAPQAQNTSARVATQAEVLFPFWEDFSTSGSTPDTLKWAYGANVYISPSLAKNPPTYQAATFDGLQGNGAAYDLTSEFNAPTDSLVSQPIPMGTDAIDQNSTYLSFFWQAGGYGELPDDNDSIRVQLLDVDSVWHTVWGQVGGEENAFETFQQEIIKIDDQRFFHNNLRIKFQAFTSRRGPFDTWHIDYIYLNDNRSSDDLSHFDRGMTGVLTNLFAPYHEISIHQFNANPERYLSPQQTQVFNLDGVFHTLEYYQQIQNLATGEYYTDAFLDNGGGGGLKAYEMRRVTGASSFAWPELTEDSLVLQSTFYYKTGDKHLFEQVVGTDTVFEAIDLKVNDTIRAQYTLHNHLAYDDGTAEFAAALNLLQGQLAIKFGLEAPDTLSHIDIYFPSIAPDASSKSIDIKVWNQLSDRGIKISQPFTVPAPTGLNAFTRIQLSEPILVEDTFYIGYQQNTDNYLGVGFDRSNPAASDMIYYNVSDGWEQNTQLKGAIMIRPVFDADTLITTELSARHLSNHKVYPNPGNGIIHVTNAPDQLQVFDLTGAYITSIEASAYKSDVFDLSFLEDGIYLLVIDNNSPPKKLIIRHE